MTIMSVQSTFFYYYLRVTWVFFNLNLFPLTRIFEIGAVLCDSTAASRSDTWLRYHSVQSHQTLLTKTVILSLRSTAFSISF